MMRKNVVSMLAGFALAALLLVLADRFLGQRDDSPPAEKPGEDANPIPAPRGKLADWRGLGAISDAAAIASLEGLGSNGLIALLREIDSQQASPEKMLTLSKAFDRLAELDLAAALEFAASEWEFDQRLPIIRGAVLKWANDDIDACWEWVEATGSGREDAPWKQFLKDVFTGRALAKPSSREIARTWSELERCSDNLEQAGRPELKPEQGVFTDPVTQMPVGTVWTLINAARQSDSWAQTLERILALPGKPFYLCLEITHNWVAEDLDAAVEWIASRETKEERNVFDGVMQSSFRATVGSETYFDKQAYFDKLFEIAPDRAWNQIRLCGTAGASERLAKVPADDPRHDRARLWLGMQLCYSDIDAAIAWAQSVVDERRRTLALGAVAHIWSTQEPWAAQRWAREDLGWDDEECAKHMPR